MGFIFLFDQLTPFTNIPKDKNIFKHILLIIERKILSLCGNKAIGNRNKRLQKIPVDLCSAVWRIGVRKKCFLTKAMKQVDRGLMEPREDPGSLKEQNVSTENVFYIALSS